jgi:LPS export ABC transporter protein LptC
MIKEPRNLLWIVPLVGLITFPLWQPIAAKILRPPHSVEKKADAILSAERGTRTAEMLEVDFMQSKAGRKEWQIKAGRMYSLDGEKDIQLEEVEAIFFGDPVKKTGQTQIRSQRASYNADQQLLNLHDQVVINDVRGYEILTESLAYLGKEKKITTDSKVKITGSNIAVRGDRLVYDVESGNYRLEGNIVCKVW